MEAPLRVVQVSRQAKRHAQEMAEEEIEKLRHEEVAEEAAAVARSKKTPKAQEDSLVKYGFCAVLGL